MGQIQAKNLAELLSFAAANGPILVDFYAVWCPPCKAIAPYVHQQCKNQGIPFAKVDVDKNGEASSKYGINCMPTFKVLGKNGQVIASVEGGGQHNVNTMIKAVQGAR